METDSDDSSELVTDFLRRARRNNPDSVRSSLRWLVQMGQLEAAESSSRTRSRRPLFDGLLGDLLPGHPAQPEQTLPCGLRQDQAYDLMSRELTPEDFEALSKLDESVPKRDIAETDMVDHLRRVTIEDCKTNECGVCLSELDNTAGIVQLPCEHAYHPACISKWLTQCKNACPMCSAPIKRPVVDSVPKMTTPKEEGAQSDPIYI